MSYPFHSLIISTRYLTLSEFASSLINCRYIWSSVFWMLLSLFWRNAEAYSMLILDCCCQQASRYNSVCRSESLLSWRDSVAKCPAFAPSAVSSNLSENGHNPQHSVDGLGTSRSTTSSKESDREYVTHTEIACEQGFWTWLSFKK